MRRWQRLAWFGFGALMVLATAIVVAEDRGATSRPIGSHGLALAATSVDGPERGVGRYVAPATGTTLDGDESSWETGRGERATVIALTSVSCPLAQRFAPALGRIEAAYADRGVRFVYVNVSGLDSREAMREQVAAHGFEGLYLDDQHGKIASALRAETTTEVFVVDRANTLIYRGAVSDQYGLRFAHAEPRRRYLEAALDAVLDGRRPETAATSAPGCLIDAPAGSEQASQPVTYTGEIARIMQSSCIECHRDGGIAPFSLTTYTGVARRARMIGAVVDEGIMPPWFAAPPEQRPSPWQNDRSLSAAERKAIADWIEAGMPEGDPAHAPAPLPWPETVWTIGEPDAIYRLPEPIEVQAEGTMPYKHVAVRTGLEEDKWVRGYQIVPGAPGVVHHVLVFVAPEEVLEDRRRLHRATSIDGHLAVYVPGNDAVVYPEGMARRLPAESVLVFQMHYTPNGRATRDQTRIGLIFDDEPEHVVQVVGIANTDIRIPAHAAGHPEQASQPVPHDARILALMPHMHVRGRAFRFELEHADGQRRTLLDVPRYDFNWQLRYAYREPLPVERGSTIHITGWFDNSAENPANPDPTRSVTWGAQTYDEMLLGYVEYYLPQADSADQADAAAAKP